MEGSNEGSLAKRGKFLDFIGSTKCLVIVLALIFVSMLLLNHFTPYLADDWAYRISFSTQKPIGSVLDIFPSMVVHAQRMNGRLFSHGLAQVFSMLPNAVFDIVNAAVFTLTIYLIYRVFDRKKAYPSVTVALVFMAYCLFMPAFGEVTLWQIGSFNYLWSILVLVLFNFPFVCMFSDGKAPFKHIYQIVLFCLFSFVCGAYSEITSAVAIFAAAALTIMTAFTAKRSAWLKMIAPIVFALGGFAFMMLMPAERANKGGALTLRTIIDNLNRSNNMIRRLLPLIIVAVCLIVAAFIFKVNGKRIALSILYFVSAFVANLLPVAASYYPDRCLCTSCITLIISCAVLFSELSFARQHFVTLLKSIAAVALAVSFAFSFTSGMYDVFRTNADYKERIQQLEIQKNQGKKDIELHIVYAQTDYSVFRQARFLSTETSQTWPNNYMSKYFGVDSIIGLP